MSIADTTSLRAASMEPAQAVYAAIQDADYATHGAPFDPLLIKFAAASDFINGWASKGWASHGARAMRFFQYPSPESAEDDFRPLGDFALAGQGDASRVPVMLVAPVPGREDKLAHPIGFDWILSDKGSGNANDVHYYWPVPPPGFQSLGICVGFNGASPNPDNYWCVSNDILQDVPERSYWSDAGSRWKKNGSLDIADLTNVPSNDKLMLAPTTFLSVYQGGSRARCLVLDKLLLPGAHFAGPDPVYEEGSQGRETAPGLASVAVVPCSVVTDSSSASGPKSSPFYYLSSEPYWYCFKGMPSPEGSTYTETVMVGTSSQKSQGFQNTTSLTVGAEVGVEADAFSASMSVSYTQEMQVSAETTEEHRTEVTRSVELNLPKARSVYLWQAYTNIVAYRTQGSTVTGPTVLSIAPFLKDDMSIVHNGAQEG